MESVRHCPSYDDTERAGEEFAALLKPGDVIILTGPLGAGKTTFVKGLARGLGVVERVVSPTFTMVREYETPARDDLRRLHHADVYRTSGRGEILDLDLHEWREDAAVVVVEWGEMAEDLFGEVSFVITIHPDRDSEARDLTVEGPAALDRHIDLERWEAS